MVAAEVFPVWHWIVVLSVSLAPYALVFLLGWRATTRERRR